MKTLSLLFIFLAAACGGGNDNTEPIYSEEAVMADAFEMVEEEDFLGKKNTTWTPQNTSTSHKDQESFDQKIIKTGNLTYKVEVANEEQARVKELLSKYDAYLASESQNKGYDRINYNLSIKVPPQYFDSLMSELMEGKRVDNKWINSDNVTDRFYDLQSRIGNKKKLEARYQEILNKANSVRDILEVERSLNQVRSEIESLQGQFKLLNHRINYSTLDVTFYEILPYEVDDELRPGFLVRISNALSSGWQGFISFLVFAVRLWPFIILTFLAIMVVRKLRNRKAK